MLLKVTFPSSYFGLVEATSAALKKCLPEGMGAEGKRGKTKNISVTQLKARAGWPKRLRLIQATP